MHTLPTIPTRRLAAAASAVMLLACAPSLFAAPVPPASASASMSTPPPAADKPAPTSADIVAACERAVREALPVAQRADVSFNTVPAVQPRLSDASQTVLRGAGRVKARAFTYSCNVDAGSGEAIGVVLRQAPAAESAARPAVEPDLSQVSPQACESRAAEALKKRWPSVSQISFDSTTRSLRQDAADRAELRGQGHALPTPNSPSTFFDFDCTIDPRDGRVLSARVSG